MLKLVHLCDSAFKDNTGTGVVIPQYAYSQSKYANVCLLNMSDVKAKITGCLSQYTYRDFNHLSISDKNRLINSDLYIIHTVYSLKIVLFWFLYLRKKHNYILLPHGSFTKTSQKKSRIKKQCFNFLFLNSIVKKSKGIHFLTKNEKLESIYSTKNDFIIPNGINPPNRKNIGYHKYNYTYIGRLDIYYKGLDVLLESINDLNSQGKLPKMFVLNIYGTDIDDSTNKLKKYILEHNLSNIIFIHDGVFNQQKIDVLCNSTYFIQTSRSEGLPLGIIEALSYGLPVLITDSTNLSDVISESNCGFFCTCNKMQISKMILESINNIDKWNILSQNARNCASQFYWENISKECINKYQEILGGD